MPSLFSDIRGFSSAKYSGRYLALLLRELGHRDPMTFARIFRLSRNDTRALQKDAAQVVHERRFQAKGGKTRIADLAALQASHPIFLLEIKEDDVASPTNAAQLADYMDLTTSSSVSIDRQTHFVHVSRYALPNRERAAIAG